MLLVATLLRRAYHPTRLGSQPLITTQNFVSSRRLSLFIPISLFLLGDTFCLLPRHILSAKSTMSTTVSAAGMPHEDQLDPVYPGTSVIRMMAVRDRVRSLTEEQLDGDWEDVRRSLLWAGGLRDLPNALPGQGYTGHCFNDFNHCDLTTMRGADAHNENSGRVAGIHRSNPLGRGIEIASLEELGPGGSWTTCMMGCQKDPPHDVAHIQFRSRIAFKLVW